MSYATLDRHAREIFDSIGPSAEEQLEALESAVERMRIKHEGQLRHLRSLYQQVVDELELARAANRGLMQSLRACRAAKKREKR